MRVCMRARARVCMYVFVYMCVCACVCVYITYVHTLTQLVPTSRPVSYVIARRKLAVGYSNCILTTKLYEI